MGNNYTTGAFDKYFYGVLIPNEIAVNWIGGTLRVSWCEFYTPDVYIEVWDSINGANPVLLGVTALGASSFEIAADNTQTHSITVRATKNNAVSGFSQPSYSGFSAPIVIPPVEFYYVDFTAGVDVAGVDGSIATPWKTLAYAATRATTPGDLIHLVADTFIETQQIVLAEGVSVIGVGAASIIQAGANLQPLILMQSVAENSQGNQSITQLQIDGNLTSDFGLAVRRRSNVVIDNVTMYDFNYTGIEIYGGSGFASTPATFLSGIVISNCDISNCCSRRDPGIFGAIRLGGTIGALIHDCILTQTGRALATNGNLLYLWGAINKGFKFYNNTCTKPTSDGIIVGNGNGWNFHIESGPCNGAEIYDNTFVGGVAIDYAGGDQFKGDYDYSWWIHDNNFSLTAQIAPLPAGTHVPYAMDFERTNEDIIVERNVFTNFPSAINFTTSSSAYHKCRIHFRYNQFLACGYSDASYGFGALYFKGAAVAVGDLYYDIYFYNNLCVANGARAFFALQSACNITNLVIINNIFVNSVTYGYIVTFAVLGDLITPTGNFTGLVSDNNLIFNNAHANTWYGVDGKLLYFSSYADNILATDPLFVGGADYHLQVGSPCRNTGKVVGLTEDYDLVPLPIPPLVPDIGVYQYV